MSLLVTHNSRFFMKVFVCVSNLLCKIHLPSTCHTLLQKQTSDSTQTNSIFLNAVKPKGKAFFLFSWKNYKSTWFALSCIICMACAHMELTASCCLQRTLQKVLPAATRSEADQNWGMGKVKGNGWALIWPQSLDTAEALAVPLRSSGNQLVAGAERTWHVAEDARYFELNWVREQQQCSDSVGQRTWMMCFIFWVLPNSLGETFIHFPFFVVLLSSLGICSSGYCCIAASRAIQEHPVEVVLPPLSSS